MLVLVALFGAIIVTSIEKHFGKSNDSFIILEYIKNVWIALKIDFGGEPGHEHENLTLKIILFTYLTGGIVIWGAYQASLTSELSVVKIKLPFNDLESLYNSNFRLLGPSWSWSISDPFKSKNNDSIYVKVFKKNMGGNKTGVLSNEEALEEIVGSGSKAYTTSTNLNLYESYHCKEST